MPGLEEVSGEVVLNTPLSDDLGGEVMFSYSSTRFLSWTAFSVELSRLVPGFEPRAAGCSTACSEGIVASERAADCRRMPGWSSNPC